jgi:hypothetical protein
MIWIGLHPRSPLAERQKLINSVCAAQSWAGGACGGLTW